jgi:hypothetical protein
MTLRCGLPYLLPAAMTDLLKGGSLSSVDLDEYGVAVLEDH